VRSGAKDKIKEGQRKRIRKEKGKVTSGSISSSYHKRKCPPNHQQQQIWEYPKDAD